MVWGGMPWSGLGWGWVGGGVNVEEWCGGLGAEMSLSSK